jgi:hypothetical protein
MGLVNESLIVIHESLSFVDEFLNFINEAQNSTLLPLALCPIYGKLPCIRITNSIHRDVGGEWQTTWI